MDYRQACQYLDQLQFFKIKLGLDAVAALLEQLGNPQQHYPTIHLAGTNGKGSVGAILTSLLGSAGYTVGFYSSPHLACVRERFTINGEWISEEDFSALITTIQERLGHRQITYFECTTAMALLYFANRKVDVAIIETGLGGRLDATNILTPAVSVITSIALDHEQYLGDTIAEVAGEKAGIIKEGVPVVSGVLDAAAQAVIQQKAVDKKSELYILNRDFYVQIEGSELSYTGIDHQIYDHLPCPLAGKHQARNTAIALAALEVYRKQQDEQLTFTDLAHQLTRVRWPGRMERVEVVRNNTQFSYLFDGAHNEAGIEALVESLSELNVEHFVLVWGSMKDKTLGTQWQRLLERAGTIIFTQAEPERSASPDHLLHLAAQAVQDKIRCNKEVDQALAQAEHIARKDTIICVAGSLYLVGKARTLVVDDSSIYTNSDE